MTLGWFRVMVVLVISTVDVIVVIPTLNVVGHILSIGVMIIAGQVRNAIGLASPLPIELVASTENV